MVQPSPHPAPAPLLSAADVRRIAAELDLRPTKQWGQNFVIDPNTIRRIVQAADVTADEHVLEIGPGLGSLTLGLLDVAARVVAIEIDPDLAGALPATIADRAPAYVERKLRLDLLGDLVEEHLDVDALLGLVRRGAPTGLTILPPGAGR